MRLIDPMLDLFKKEEWVRYCPSCLNETSGNRRQCRLCHLEIHRGPREDLEEFLGCQPIRHLGEQVAAGPPKVPADLTRVQIAHNLQECTKACRELEFVGISAWTGSDSMDVFDIPYAIGLYVRREDEEAARFILDGIRSDDPLATSPKVRTKYDDPVLEEAHGYLGIGKLRDVIRVLERSGDNGDAQLMVTEALMRSGRLRDAVQQARAAAGRLRDPRSQGQLLAQAGMALALGYDGTPFGDGANLGEARRNLEEARRLAPRVLSIRQMLIEVLVQKRDQSALREEVRSADRLNPNLLAMDGWYRSLSELVKGPSR